MNYLPDANVCIGLINGRRPELRAAFERLNLARETVFVSALVVFDLAYGAAKSDRRGLSEEHLARFLRPPIRTVAFDDNDARRAGDIRASFERQGRPIGAYDVLIAGQALQRDYTLVTANVREFARVPGLRCQDWSRA